MNLKKLPDMINIINLFQGVDHKPALPIRYWTQDESRFGLHTITRSVLTALDIKPIRPMQLDYQFFYLYGTVEPQTGDRFFLEFSHLDADCFQLFLNEFSQAYPKSLNIIQLDNGRFHKAQKLTIPDNVVLLFQPPYSPDMNPIERVWQSFKDKLGWLNFKSLDQLRKELGDIIQSILPDELAFLTRFDFILTAINNKT